MEQKKKALGNPTLSQIEAELQKEKHKRSLGRIIKNTVIALVAVVAVAAIAAVMIFPVLQIKGTSMTKTLWEGDIVIAHSGSRCKRGDVIAFYYNNSILVKRVIAVAGDWVDIDEEGNVYVNGEMQEEPYVVEKALGYCDITFPYQVPMGRVFVLGDHRATSVDSRNAAIGCVSEELMVGKILFRVWPLSDMGIVK